MCNDQCNDVCVCAILYISLLVISIVSHNWTFVIGGNGYINDYPTGRFLRDAKLYEIGAGTSEVRRIILGRAFNNMYLNK